MILLWEKYSVANEFSSSVSVISDSSNSVIETISVGVIPYGVAYDSGLGEIFVTNAVSQTASVISDDSTLAGRSVSVSPGSVDQGQTSTLTFPAVTSTSPYTYQWYSEAPGASSYSPISGATSSTYDFATSTTSPATATGSWSFYLQVTNKTGVQVADSAAASVIVNSPLVAPSASASLGTVDQGQAASLTSTVVTTGTSPYTYQWFSEAPAASSYSMISGATSSSYDFVTSTTTTTGSWGFMLQVTDNTGAAVNSNAVTVKVNVAPTVSITPASWIMDVGQSELFTATASGGSGSYSSYQWYVGGVAQSGMTASTFSYAPSSSGSPSITVTVTDSLGATSARSSAATVTVNQLTITVTQTANGVIAPGSSPVNYGAIQSFSITPATGYYIASITANGASVTVTSPSGQILPV